MYETYLTIGLAIYGLDRLVHWYHLYTLRTLGEDYLFPDADPIRTSSLETFDYEEEEEEIPPNREYETPEEEEAPVAAPAFDYAEEEVEVEQKLDWQANADADAEHLAKETEKVPLEGRIGDGLLYMRCQALTKSGAQCKNKPTYRHKKYCRTHEE